MFALPHCHKQFDSRSSPSAGAPSRRCSADQVEFWCRLSIRIVTRLDANALRAPHAPASRSGRSLEKPTPRLAGRRALGAGWRLLAAIMRELAKTAVATLRSSSRVQQLYVNAVAARGLLW